MAWGGDGPQGRVRDGLLWRRECANAAESGTAAPELCDIRPPPALTDRLPVWRPPMGMQYPASASFQNNHS